MFTKVPGSISRFLKIIMLNVPITQCFHGQGLLRKKNLKLCLDAMIFLRFSVSTLDLHVKKKNS